MSALPPKADIPRRDFNVRFGPQADIARCPNSGLPEPFKADLVGHGHDALKGRRKWSSSSCLKGNFANEPFRAPIEMRGAS
jgi:hypothetical protein